MSTLPDIAARVPIYAVAYAVLFGHVYVYVLIPSPCGRKACAVAVAIASLSLTCLTVPIIHNFQMQFTGIETAQDHLTSVLKELSCGVVTLQEAPAAEVA